MWVVLAQRLFSAPGGSETYLLTVAEQLARLGHEPIVHGRELGEMADLAADRGVRVVTENELPQACDALLTQDGATAYALAARYPDMPQLFVTHSLLFDLHKPPQLDGIVSTVVALNDRFEANMKAMASQPTVVRLRQPVDLKLFSPRGDIRATPKRALLLGNYLSGRRYEMVVRACSALGIECERVGRHGRSDLHPERLIADADIVIGVGRCILEAMSCGRAAFTYDHRGGHGWVTPGSYPALEADGFTGLWTKQILEGEDALKGALAEYRPEMGFENRELAQAHHSANKHVTELVDLLRELAPRPESPPTPLYEMARLVRLSWKHESMATAREAEAWDLRLRAQEQEVEIGQLRHRVGVLRASRRYQLGSLLVKPLDLWRRARGRGSYSQKP